ncbi:V8-like Glu-specific endopeptidase [Mycobacteroides abscessus subsp. abscessus]|uniref:hypothetical protein n=1 Tax=Mycobacteroides abscessus TaxID=36809 RepID=UPI00092BBEB8|nr:hypothetical protein [Mycobacteroides abscessus]SIK42504.1 V8-like Glu-specific endopeptidase [Mycobacteroides abscessus subsp. abscessus]SLC46478.1 V8-like Glu-specific endopeptidase [Mycobacteroides abscessus subsp. abscessus]
MRTHRGGIAVLLGAALTAVAVISAPAAQASVGLYPGMPITNRDISSTCSLGFLATNSAGKRLAVTAGHCSTAIDQVFVSENGAKIGYVVARWDDKGDTYFGYTLLWLYDTTHTQDAYFAAWRNPGVGTAVRKYGMRTDATDGKVTAVYYKYDDERPNTSSIYSSVDVFGGDSGAPWYTFNDSGQPVLVGIHVGHTSRQEGTYLLKRAYAFPADSLTRHIRANAGVWGAGFILSSPRR